MLWSGGASYAAADRLCEYRKISKRREAKPKPRDMPMGDLRALIEAADEPALRRLLIVLVFQGWRIAETWRDRGNNTN